MTPRLRAAQACYRVAATRAAGMMLLCRRAAREARTAWDEYLDQTESAAPRDVLLRKLEIYRVAQQAAQGAETLSGAADRAADAAERQLGREVRRVFTEGEDTDEQRIAG